MFEYTLNNHFKFGYDNEWFVDRPNKNSKWSVQYGQCNRPVKNWREECKLAASIIYDKRQGLPIDISLRYALFDTDSYDTRLYSFENNALYVFAVPAYYYQGNRAYILVRYSFLRHCDLWVRYGYFLYNNRQNISSGAEGIVGSKKSDLVIQLRISF